MKKYIKFRPRIKSRHPSHDVLRGTLPLLPFKSVVRLGSSTELEDQMTRGGSRIEINTVESIKNASNKLLMKRCFTEAGVKTADWWTLEYINTDSGYTNYHCGFMGNHAPQAEGNCYHSQLPYPIVAKHIYGSRGRGNTLINNREELESWIKGKTLNNYIFEKFYNYNREYRLHVTEEGCFYTCRKMLKSDTPENDRWFRNDSNSVWIVEENPSFDKPVNWEEIIEHSVKALKSVGLDIGAVDLRVQSRINPETDKVRKNPKFIVVEINSAPSFGKITEEKYKEELPKLLNKKYNLV